MSRLSRAVPAALVALVLAAGHSFAHRPERHATEPVVSPDGKLVAYAREAGGAWQLRVIGVDGSGDTLVLSRLGDGRPIGWADGHDRLLFSSNEGASSEVWICALDGSDAHPVAGVDGKAVSRSHVGRRLAYASGTWTRSRLMVDDADGRPARALTDSSASWYTIAWSPDDSLLAVARRDSSGTLQLWLVDPITGHGSPLTAIPASAGQPQWPAWSPDGRRLAVQVGRYDRSDRTKSESDIWVVGLARGTARRITQRPRLWLDETPAWTPDGRHIVIQSTRTGRFELWVMDDDGRHPRQLTR